MSPNFRRYFALPLVALLGCQAPWDPLVGCAEFDACGTSTSGSAGGDSPTTGDGVHTVTGEGAGSTGPSDDGSPTNAGTTGEDPEDSTTDATLPPPSIGAHAVTPDYTMINALIVVTVTADAQGVRMQIDGGAPIELEQVAPGEFVGEIAAFTALPPSNGKHTATLTPWRGETLGEAVEAPYVIALPPPGYERHWSVGGQAGYVAAVDVLPDGRPVEFGTFFENGEPRCYLNLRDLDGSLVESLPVLPSAYCSATDLAIDPETGMLDVLVDRKSGNGSVWWVGQIAAWGQGPVNIGTGAVGDTALALARRPGMRAVCGSRTNDNPDGRDALAVLLRPGEQAEPRVLDYLAEDKPEHRFAENARDCKFAGDTLVLVGEARGKHGGDVNEDPRDRLAFVEVDVMTSDDPKWTVAGPGPGTQSRGLALDIDDLGRAHVVGYTCPDDCKPDGEVRVYEPGGTLASPPVQLGPLGSLWLGPHDIAWSPAGYAVVAFGELQDGDSVFKAQAVALGVAEPLWTFLPLDWKGSQLALVAKVGPNGEVYLGGIADGHPAFAVSGG